MLQHMRPPPELDRGYKRKGGPTVDQIFSDPLTQLSMKVWAPQVPPDRRVLIPDLINNIYQRECLNSGFSTRRLMILELSQYLENYLWPHFHPGASKQHVLSIVAMVNEKYREGLQPWDVFVEFPDRFPSFFHAVLDKCLSAEKEVRMKEQLHLLIFLVHCFNSLAVDLVREQVWKLVSQPTWNNLIPSRLEKELHSNPTMRKFFKKLARKDADMDELTQFAALKERKFMTRLFHKFFRVLYRVPEEGERASRLDIAYCERFLELLIDLEAQLPTRRYFNTLLDDSHLVVLCSLAPLVSRTDGNLFAQLLEILKFYAGFEINDQTGMPLTINGVTSIHYNKIASLQRAAFKNYSDLRTFALSNISRIDTRDSLKKHFTPLPYETLHNIAAYLCLVPPYDSDSEKFSKVFIIELLVSHHERRKSQLDILNQTPLYPSQDILWNENIVPSAYYSGESCLALPKLNLQFLTLHDYLLRNLQLFKLESTYEIRLDIEDSLTRMKPRITPQGDVIFLGWARMAQKVQGFSVVEVGRTNVGESWPCRVRADVTVNLHVHPDVRTEWESLRKHDVCFLITVYPTLSVVNIDDVVEKKNFREQMGVRYIRGCEIEGMLDEEGKLIEEGPGFSDNKPKFTSNERTFRVLMDPNQYQLDMNRTLKQSEDEVHNTFNIFLRRKPKENNFKAVLETTRELMNTECVVPAWIHNIFLGYGDPSDANYTRLAQSNHSFDFNDTFLSMEHLIQSFPQYTVRCVREDPDAQVPPFRVTFPEIRRGRQLDGIVSTGPESDIIIVEPYEKTNRGPYPYNQPKCNSIPFTPTQIEAVTSGMHPGLTMVVGPPGTGKTDVAVQVISNLYHNFPEQRTLIVTHSNQALNQLFEKIMCLDIEERHLLRLGHGEEALETEKDFSRFGRVNYILQLRLDLLEEVKRLQESLNVPGDVSYTCETAGHFFLYQVRSRWEKYLAEIRPGDGEQGEIAKVHDCFPFHDYFSNAPQPLFHGLSYRDDVSVAEGCFTHIKRLFEQLNEFRAFELLRSGMDRINYLLIKTAKVIAMTCTHAAMKRHSFVELGFKYDNVIMEEAAQILEIETFIPLMLQTTEDNLNRLKRVILIGDHNQLPPVIKNMAFQKFSNMEQSMFTRFIRLGVPAVHLDAQGRARPALRQLYSWRYESLGDLPHILDSVEYKCANPGFCFDYQVVNVEDFNGRGEHEPNPYFYQNLGEAEFCVALFMYMRLQGYPPDKITILSTYNGQKHLIRDILRQRCGDNPAFGLPDKVTTVDRYQGQQNDYIILSLVRTKAVGHLRDVRRLVVAMSRARLGLYVFSRVGLFQNCFELSPAFRLLTRHPLALHLYPMECSPPVRPAGYTPQTPVLIIRDMPHLASFVYDEYNRRINALTAKLGRDNVLLEPGTSLPPEDLTEETIEKYQMQLEEGEIPPEEPEINPIIAARVDDSLTETARSILESLKQYQEKCPEEVEEPPSPAPPSPNLPPGPFSFPMLPLLQERPLIGPLKFPLPNKEPEPMETGHSEDSRSPIHPQECDEINQKARQLLEAIDNPKPVPVPDPEPVLSRVRDRSELGEDTDAGALGRKVPRLSSPEGVRDPEGEVPGIGDGLSRVNSNERTGRGVLGVEDSVKSSLPLVADRASERAALLLERMDAEQEESLARSHEQKFHTTQPVHVLQAPLSVDVKNEENSQPRVVQIKMDSDYNSGKRTPTMDESSESENEGK